MNRLWTPASLIRACLAIVVLSCSGCASQNSLPAGSATAQAPSLPATRVAAIDDFIGQFVEFGMYDGTVLIDIGGDVVYQRSFGKADYEFDLPHGANTRFRIASVSKTLTDAALARLVQNGTLTLDAPLSDYLPQFPSADRITLQHLVTHKSGIAHTNRQSWGDANQSMTHDELIERLAALPLDFEPGSKSRYSNGGYAVLAKVIALAGGGTYGEVMQRQVFDPLGMADTGHINDWRTPVPNMATGYEPGPYPGERRFPRFYAVETRPGGGSLYSTVPDLLRFSRAVFRDHFIDEPLRRAILGEDESVFIAMGRSPGFIGRLYYNRERDMIVISLANNYAVPDDWTPALAGIAAGEFAKPAWPVITRGEALITEAHPWIGRYASSFGEVEMIIVRSARGALQLVDAEFDESLTAFIPLTDGSFLLPTYYQRCDRDNDSGVITCRILSGNERYTNLLTPIE